MQLGRKYKNRSKILNKFYLLIILVYYTLSRKLKFQSSYIKFNGYKMINMCYAIYILQNPS